MMNEKEDQKNFVLTDDLDLCYDYSLFSGLNRTQLKEVRKLCREECFYPGHTLFKEGEPARKIYVLVDGEIDIFFTIGEAGKVLVDQVGHGEILGCSALIPPYVHTCTARPTTKVEILEIDGEALRGLFEDDPRFAVAIQSQVIQCLMDRIVDLRLR